jgi:hypothetical protein
MRNLTIMLTLALLTGGAQADTPAVKGRLRGDYVEARTASVFAGACHYNGELTTTGREALLAWNVREGSWSGVPLAGLSAMAAVVSNANLKDAQAARRSVLYVDEKATDAQTKALAGALMERYGRALGTIVAVRRVPIAFTRSGENYRVEAKGVGRLRVDAMPNRECCKQPNLVWYKPLVELSDRRVGFTRESGVREKALDADWSKSGQNTAFYGAFAL